MCYDNTVNCKLVCGHRFCKSCVKAWYLKGTNSTCPMCRKKVHYRRMPIKKWKAEAEEEKKQQVFQECFDNMVEAIMEPLTFVIEGHDVPKTPGFIQTVDKDILTLHRTNVPMDEISDLEKTFRAIKDDTTVDELDYVLNETDDYYSDRKVHLRNRTYSENGHMYKITNKTIKSRPRRY